MRIFRLGKEAWIWERGSDGAACDSSSGSTLASLEGGGGEEVKKEREWKRVFFWLYWGYRSPPQEAEKKLTHGFVLGPIGVSKVGKWWAVTHLGTGLSVFTQKTREQAMTLGELLAREPYRSEMYDIPHVRPARKAVHTIALRESIWKLGGVVDMSEVKK